MAIAATIREAQTKGSFIRTMFEESARLKLQHGADKVHDFSLGNPDLDPPADFRRVLVALASEEVKGAHAYMANAGIMAAREALAKKTSREHGVRINGSSIVMTVGAAGALNVVLKAILDPGDEIVVSRPYFMEYASYASNHGGTLVVVDSRADFDLDIDAISHALTPKTAAVLINSPHNPTGRVYPAATIAALADALYTHGQKTSRFPYLIADEPYREIVFDGREVPGILGAYRESIVVTSYSKSLSLPGERIGYIAVGPEVTAAEELVGAFAYTTRILGFVNAPALMQRAVAELTESRVDAGVYARRKDAFISVLSEAGIRFAEPQGAFYLFCEVPVKKGSAGQGDDKAFVNLLKEHLVLAVPGSGFGAPGYFRLAYCVDEKKIEASRSAFKVATEKWRAILDRTTEVR